MREKSPAPEPAGQEPKPQTGREREMAAKEQQEAIRDAITVEQANRVVWEYELRLAKMRQKRQPPDRGFFQGDEWRF